MNIAQEGHVVNMMYPQGVNGGQVSDVVSMKKANHIDIVVQLGATVGASVRVTVQECDDVTPTASTSIAFGYQKEELASDTLQVRGTATSTGLRISATAGAFAVLSLDSADLTDGYPFVQVTIEDPGATTIAGMTAILTGHRYGKELTATALT